MSTRIMFSREYVLYIIFLESFILEEILICSGLIRNENSCLYLCTGHAPHEKRAQLMKDCTDQMLLHSVESSTFIHRQFVFQNKKQTSSHPKTDKSAKYQ